MESEMEKKAKEDREREKRKEREEREKRKEREEREEQWDKLFESLFKHPETGQRISYAESRYHYG
jgi:hypothetical protein